MNSKDHDELIGYCFSQFVTVAILSLCEALIGFYVIMSFPIPTNVYDATFKDIFCMSGGLFVFFGGLFSCYDSITEAIDLWKKEKTAIKKYWEKED